MDMKCVPRLRAGIGQGFDAQKNSAAPAVRIRTGEQAGVGQVIKGEDGRLTAFVWTEEAKAAPTRVVVVQAGLDGHWLREGLRAVRLREAFQGDRELVRQLTRLQNQGEDWQRFLAKYYNPATPFRFDWGRFNEEGLRLARRLQAALIDDAVVRYYRAEQDRQYRASPEMAV